LGSNQKKKKTSDNSDNENNNNGLNLMEGKEEMNIMKNSSKPFSNIKFNNNRNTRLHNRNENSKVQFSLQKDQTDRGLLKSNL